HIGRAWYTSQNRGIATMFGLRAATVAFIVWGLRAAEPGPCDPSILAQADRTNPYAYSLIGDRCEGVFSQNVAGTGSLLFASFLKKGLTPENPPAPLMLTWKHPVGAASVHLRAIALRA